MKIKKGQIHASGFTLIGWDIIQLSHGCQAVDMWVFIAGIVTGDKRTMDDDICNILGADNANFVGEI